MRESVSHADHEHVVEVAGLEQRRAGDELVDEARAPDVDVERSAAQSEAVADERAGVGDGLLGSRGGDDEEVDRVGREPRALDRVRAGFDRERRGGLTFGGDAPFADPGALDDPLIAGVDARLEVGVRETSRRDGRTPTGDARAHQATRNQAIG